MKLVKLPELGEGVTEGELVRWLVKVGDSVQPDQPVAEFMTDKATVEVPSPVAGKVMSLKFKEGDSVKVDSVILELEEAAGSVVNKTGNGATSKVSGGGAGVAAATPATQGRPAAAAPSPIPHGGATSLVPVKLPEIGEGVTEGELVRLLVKVGDLVTIEQPIAEVMTDKATVEVPSPVAGRVTQIMVKEGQSIKVGEVLLQLESGAASAESSRNLAAAGLAHVTSVPASQQAAPALSAQASRAPVGGFSASLAMGRGAISVGGGLELMSEGAEVYPPPAQLRVLATPFTRRLARQLNVDINQIQGSGLAGRVTKEDVLRAAEAQGSLGVTSDSKASFKAPTTAGVPVGALEERIPLRGIRKKIAENMQQSKRIIPHFTLMDEAIVTDLVKAREQIREVAQAKNIKVTYMPFVIKALIATCREFPVFNASIDDAAGEIVYKKYFHIGFAADTPNGLVVPVIKNAQDKNLWDLAAEIQDLSQRARDGKLKPDEMKGATITITNIGSVGGTYATPIINHPEVAILGMYKIMDKVVVDPAGQFRVEKAMNFTITADHRLIDGAVAARFLKSFIQKVSQPSLLLLDLR